uniref:Uncharacterized protein n=1 Tax=Anguilla anguilla TaxID=7936 RepID=A0A0E9V710_ANGAN
MPVWLIAVCLVLELLVILRRFSINGHAHFQHLRLH